MPANGARNVDDPVVTEHSDPWQSLGENPCAGRKLGPELSLRMYEMTNIAD